VIGTIVGVVQTDIKRLLAYSSIAHAGFILVALTGFSQVGAKAILFYLLAYGLATVGAFAVVSLVRERLAGASGEEDSVILGEATHLAQWAGIGRKAPWLTVAFVIFLLSMAGIPLTAGFVAKFGVFSAAVDAGQWPLALLGVVASAISVFFYIRIIVLLVLTPSSDDAPEVAASAAPASGVEDPSDVIAGGGLATLTQTRAVVTVLTGWSPATVVVALCAVGVIVVGIMPSWILDLAAGAAKFVP
jgi:NADH-quinone oxidoreductase subunit N